MKHKIFFLVFVLAFSVLTMKANTPQHFKMNAQPSSLKVKQGEEFTIKLDLKFEKGWYTYSMNEIIGPLGFGPEKTEITVEPKSLADIKGKIKQPKITRKMDEAFETEIETIPQNSTFIIPLVAKKDLFFDKDKFNIVVTLQQCYAEGCLPPDDFKVLVSTVPYLEETKQEEILTSDQTDEREVDSVSVGSSMAEDTPIDETKSIPIQEEEIAQEEPKSIWMTLIIAMAAGAAALLTPCVFPMVPITVSFFTKRAEQAKGKGLRDALVYAFGIIFTFTGLGLVFSLIFGATGIQEFTASPWVNMFIVGIFILFGLSLFGLYELQIPTSITNKLNTKSMQGDGVISVVLMALTFSLASFSCTGPLVAAALVGAAQGEWFYPMISMLGFSTVLAAPFFFLALFPTALNSLPKAGGWMNNVKVVLGFVVLAVTLKFLDNALVEWGVGLSREIFLAFWISVGAFVTIYILGIFKMSHDSPVDKVGFIRLFFAMIFATFTIYLFTGFSGKPMGTLEAFLPAPSTSFAISTASGSAEATTQAVWFDNYEEALAEAKKQNKPIFIDFTGKHCPNCRLMERNVFPKPEVMQRFEKMVNVKLITDVRSEPFLSNRQMQLERFGTVAIPFYVILSPEEELLSQTAYTPKIEDFLQFLDKGIQSGK